ncbi:hypothetical protein ACFLYU_02605 [Candidatus Dependentiae bacterium]
MKRSKILLAIACCILCLSSHITVAKIYFDKAGKEIAKNKKVLDVIILLDTKGEENKTRKKQKTTPAIPISKTLTKAINQNQLIITNNSLMRTLFLLPKIKSLRRSARKAIDNLLKNYLVYKNKSNSFAILIPKKTYADVIDLKKPNVENIGLNKNLIRVSTQTQTDIQNTFSKKHAKINIKELNQIFSLSDNAKKIEKRVFLMGHGLPAKEVKLRITPLKKTIPQQFSLIGQLKKDQYVAFLKNLKKINCTFLYILSCYAGGWNQLVMQKEQIQKEQKKIYKKVLVPFPIITGNLSDSSAIEHKSINFETFFYKLNTFFTQELKKYFTKNWKLKRPWEQLKILAPILIQIGGTSTRNIPTVKLPGQNIVLAIPLNNWTVVITQKKLLSYQIVEKPAFVIDSMVENVLLYPAIINFTLKINTAKKKIIKPLNQKHKFFEFYPATISMIPGYAHHYIKKIIIHANHIYDVGSFFSQFSHKGGFFEKLFFIKTLVINFRTKDEHLAMFGIKKPVKSITFENVAIKTIPKHKSKTNKLGHHVIFKVNGTYFQYIDYFLKNPIPMQKDVAANYILEFAKETAPTKEALKQTTFFDTEKKFDLFLKRSLFEDIITDFPSEIKIDKTTKIKTKNLPLINPKILKKINENIGFLKRMIQDQFYKETTFKLLKLFRKDFLDINKKMLEEVFILTKQRFKIKHEKFSPMLKILNMLLRTLKYFEIILISEDKHKAQFKITGLLKQRTLKRIFDNWKKGEKIIDKEIKEITKTIKSTKKGAYFSILKTKKENRLLVKNIMQQLKTVFMDLSKLFTNIKEEKIKKLL